MDVKNVLRIGQMSVPGSQGGTVYSMGGSALQSAQDATDTQSDTSLSKYQYSDRISYCIDANYWKGTTVEGFIEKHRRQLVIVYDG